MYVSLIYPCCKQRDECAFLIFRYLEQSMRGMLGAQDEKKKRKKWELYGTFNVSVKCFHLLVCHTLSERATFRVAPDELGQAAATTLTSPVIAASHRQLHLVLSLIDGSFVLQGVAWATLTPICALPRGTGGGGGWWGVRRFIGPSLAVRHYIPFAF